MMKNKIFISFAVAAMVAMICVGCGEKGASDSNNSTEATLTEDDAKNDPYICWGSIDEFSDILEDDTYYSRPETIYKYTIFDCPITNLTIDDLDLLIDEMSEEEGLTIKNKNSYITIENGNIIINDTILAFYDRKEGEDDSNLFTVRISYRNPDSEYSKCPIDITEPRPLLIGIGVTCQGEICRDKYGKSVVSHRDTDLSAYAFFDEQPIDSCEHFGFAGILIIRPEDIPTILERFESVEIEEEDIDPLESDIQLCESIRTTIQTLLMDPMIVTDNGYNDIVTDEPVIYSSIEEMCDVAELDIFRERIVDWLNISGDDIDLELSGRIMTEKGQNICVYLSTNNMIVYIPNSSMTGDNNKNSKPSVNESESCIYAGTLTGEEIF